MDGVLRTEIDVGLLTNRRMGLEIAVGLAFLTGRRLSLPFDLPIPPAPRTSIAAADMGPPATLLDLLEVPLEVVEAEEWDELASQPADCRDWGDFHRAVCVCADDVDLRNPQFVDFANGRSQLRHLPASTAKIVDLRGRPLAFYSYFFFARPALNRQLKAVLRGVRPRRPYAEIGAEIAAGLGHHNAIHLRRSDLTMGIPAYGEVTPDQIADNVAEVLPNDELLLVCSEVNGSDELFDPLRRRFRKIVFANDIIVGDYRESFLALPRHEDNALGVITQEVASRSLQFVGTLGSTFSAMIQRTRLFRDPRERFRYTADFTQGGSRFHRGEFRESSDGCFTWNRVNLAMAPETLSWFREWPEAQ